MGDTEQQIAVLGKDKTSLEESVHGSCFHNKDNTASFVASSYNKLTYTAQVKSTFSAHWFSSS